MTNEEIVESISLIGKFPLVLGPLEQRFTVVLFSPILFCSAMLQHWFTNLLQILRTLGCCSLKSKIYRAAFMKEPLTIWTTFGAPQPQIEFTSQSSKSWLKMKRKNDVIHSFASQLIHQALGKDLPRRSQIQILIGPRDFMGLTTFPHKLKFP